MQQQPVPGAEIIALSEHVDYWNSPGWGDPYSSAEFSKRQRIYERSFKLDSVYTPQMVVNGQTEFVGSDKVRAQEVIASAASTPSADVQITRAAADPGKVDLKVRVQSLPVVRSGDRAEVLLAITEDNLHSYVARGENAGRHLAHTAVVRRLQTIGNARSQETFIASPHLTIASAWKRKDLHAVVFVQERESRRILGAAALPLAEMGAEKE